MRAIGVEQRRARLARRHLLLPGTRTDDVAALADALVALHSSDPVTVYLSALARMAHPCLAAVDAALYEQRSVVRHHAVRRTLWVATPEVVRELHGAATLALVTPERRRTAGYLAVSGVERPEAWLGAAAEQVVADLRAHGPSTARELGERIPALRQPIVVGGPRWGATQSAHTRVLLGLGFAGVLLRTRPVGSWVSGAYRYALAEDWLPGGLGDLDPRTARAALARRHLERFGPVSTDDLRWWTGWTAAATRAALADVGAQEVALATGPAWMAAGDVAEVEDPGPWVAALPSLDPTTMGWKERAWYLPQSAEQAFDTNGNAGPTLWVDGRVVGAWAQAPDGRMLTHWFEAVPAARRAELDDRLAVLAAAVGETRYSVRFPGREHPRILAGRAEGADQDG
ncbi:DNA glycosylase AlkZ-like family protein [Microlunatus flavus]|uniref:Winged helix DNA-binding domain-containing protein n=1 Tax=Microlunatus flavus TaxID=1036181 RepID=A0A1H9MUN4_9ACTN|nr:crosslink repair DNA glycosylase YcaQ family protein [Microlunatus flavus]SER26823.1 Winged helix DNA-binding domain-containing protein [Microlunatus flavus]